MTGRYSRNGKCKITFNNACVGLVILQNKLYLSSLRDDVNVVCDDGNVACDNVNVSSSVDVNRKIKESSRCIVEIMALSFRPYFEGENRKTS